MRLLKRVNLFAGHYGSGKTNIAVNYALKLKATGKPVAIADLDIVNPYFRTKDSIDELQKADIEFVASEYAGSNVDFPAIPGEMYSLFDRKDRYAVLDIGGDDRGAYALGRYKDRILEENDYDMFLVVNMYRPLTATPELVAEIKNEIETACGIKFTKLINNSNLGSATTAEDVFKSFDYTAEICRLTGLAPAYLTMTEDVFSELKSLCVPLPDEDRVGKYFLISLQHKIFEEV